MSNSYVLVIGAAGIDTTGQAHAALVSGSSIPGTIKSTSGGVARNVAENLARLGESVVLLTAVGNDGPGLRIQHRLQDANINTEHLIMVDGARTASYIALFDAARNPIYSIDDMSVMEEISAQLIYRKRTLIHKAKMVMLDSNLSEGAIASLMKQAIGHNVPIVADPTSTGLADKLLPYLPDLYMVTPNANEAEVLSGQKIRTRQDATSAARNW